MANSNGSNSNTYSYGRQTQYQKLLNDATDYQDFSYDPSKDPSYSAYRKQYLREADRAQQDAIAQASAMSGGRPSSYAVTAGQQAGNYYRGQLNDVIPTLEQNAYQRHLSDFDARQSAYSAISTDRDFDYNAYLQKWNNAWTLYNSGVRTPEVLSILGIPESTGTGETPTTGSRKNPANNNNNNNNNNQANQNQTPDWLDGYMANEYMWARHS